MSTYSTNLKVELIGTGEQTGTWGTTTNSNFSNVFEQSIVGRVAVNFATDANKTLSTSDSVASQDFRNVYLNLTSSGSLTVTRDLIVPTINKNYVIQNNTTGGQSIRVITAAGTGITVPNGSTVPLYVDGTNVIQAFDFLPTFNIGTLDLTNIEVTNIKAKDGTASATIANSTGVMTINSSVLTTTDINGGTIDGTIIGGITPAAATFTTAAVTTATVTTGNITTVNATNVNTTNLDLTNLEVTNIKAKDGTASATIADSTGVMTIASSVLTTTDINGGTIDGATIGASSASSGVFTSLSNSGNLTFTGTGNRILGDFSGAPVPNRTMLQTSTTNGSTIVGLVTNGTGTSTAIRYFNNSSAENCAQFDVGLLIAGTEARIASTITGTGTYVPMTFATGGSERMRIDTSGNLLVGTTSANSSKLNSVKGADTGPVIRAGATSGSFTGALYEGYGARISTNGTYKLIEVLNGDNSGLFRVLDSGNAQNTNNSYGGTSDIKLKENIVDATPKLEDLCKVKVRSYNFKNKPEEKQIGVVAQELEEVFAGLVEENIDRDKDGNDLGTTTKAVKYSVFVPMLIKAIQELNAKVDAQALEIQALKNTPAENT